MRIERITLCILALSGIFSAYANEWAFTGIIPGGHRGPVSALVHKGDMILSAGEDGFLELWNINTTGGNAGGSAAYRFQVSPYHIIAMAGRPETDEVCIVESDGLGLYRIAAWNYKERRNIFTLSMRDPITQVYYSAGGTFIIAARAGRAGLIFIDSVSGNTRPSPQSLSGTVGPAVGHAVGHAVGLAVTGRTERNMLVYFSSGALSYWDLESGNETNRFDVPADLRSPILFSNNRYLAGINAEGLTVINAISGELLARDSSIPGGSLLCSAGDDFICVTQQENTELYRYTIGRTGRLGYAARFSLSAAGRDNYFTTIAAGASTAGTIALGTADGTLLLTGTAGRNGQHQTLTTKEQLRITEAAVSGSAIAFISENGTIGFIPVNYNLLLGRRTIRMERMQGDFNRITAFAEKDTPNGQFVFWHDRNTRSQPLILSSSPGDRKLTLSDITFRFPVQSVDSLGEKILFLDSTGNLTVVSPSATPAAAVPSGEAKSRPFTFFSVGLLGAAFIDRSRIIVGRSTISGNTPLMVINIDTGETVPLPYPTQAGAMLHRGSSGCIYAVTVDSSETNGITTSIVQLNLADIAHSIKLADFHGEDTQFSIAESPGGTAGSFAATIGGESAVICSGTTYQKLERTAGLPFKLIDGGQYLINLDRDGTIAWHENRSGKLLAVFRLHPGSWTLQTEQRTMTGTFNSQ